MLSALLHPIDLAIDAYLVGMPTNDDDDDDDDLKGTSMLHMWRISWLLLYPFLWINFNTLEAVMDSIAEILHINFIVLPWDILHILTVITFLNTFVHGRTVNDSSSIEIIDSNDI